MKRLFILCSILVCIPLFAQEDKQELGVMISEVEEDVIVGESGIPYEESKVQEAAPVPVSTAASEVAPVVKGTVAPKGDVYHYAYTPKDSEPVNYSSDLKAGQPGVFIFSIFGEWVNYYTGTKNKGGASIDIGVQFNLSKYMSLALTTNIGGREGNEPDNALTPIGLRLAPRFRILPWLFLFPEGGVEFTKIAKGDWEFPFWVMGGGLMFNLGGMDKRAEYNFNRSTSVTRTLLIVAFDRIKSPDVTVVMPDSYILRLGLSLEF